MFKKSCYLIFLFTLGCTPSSEVQINLLVGYWEIEFITQENEKFSPKAQAPLYVHYQLNFPNGLLNKVAPLLDGSYSSSEDVTPFIIEKLNKNYYIRFQSRWDDWSRKIYYLDSQKLILENENRAYHYKRPIKLDL